MPKLTRPQARFLRDVFSLAQRGIETGVTSPYGSQKSRRLLLSEKLVAAGLATLVDTNHGLTVVLTDAGRAEVGRLVIKES